MLTKKGKKIQKQSVHTSSTVAVFETKQEQQQRQKKQQQHRQKQQYQEQQQATTDSF